HGRIHDRDARGPPGGLRRGEAALAGGQRAGGRGDPGRRGLIPNAVPTSTTTFISVGARMPYPFPTIPATHSGVALHPLRGRRNENVACPSHGLNLGSKCVTGQKSLRNELSFLSHFSGGVKLSGTKVPKK
ncbi:MAG: hypothetical protein UT94_C0023G0001, partial [Candidatus Uhrbacteria bacterium GW2011_GWF2_40_263]